MNRSPVTVIIGAGPDARRVRSALVDFTAIGMIDRFLWAESQMDSSGAGPTVEDISVTEVGLTIEHTSLAKALHADGGRESLLVVLDLAGDPDHRDEDVRAWQQHLTTTLRSSGHSLHIVIPDERRLRPRQYGSIQTLVLSPEDAVTPLSPGAQVQYPDFQHAASTVASVAGLWATATESPYVEAAAARQITGNRGYARLVRSYHNYRDATDVENQLHQQVFDLRRTLPHPRLHDGRRVLDIGDDRAAAAAYADAVIAGYDSAFVTPLHTPEPLGRTGLDPGRSLQRFFIFLFRVLFPGGGAWLQDLLREEERAVTPGVRVVLEDEAPELEKVLGAGPGRRSAGLAEATAAAARLNQRLNPESDGLSRATGTSLAPFWRSYVDAALTLVDGGGHGVGADEIPGPRLDNTPAIVAEVRCSVPADEHAFAGENRVLSDIVGSRLEQTRIQAYDPYGARVYAEAIDYAARNTTNASVHALKHDFDTWVEESRHSFGWQMGERIVDKMRVAGEKVRACRERAAEYTLLHESFDGDEAETRSLARWTRGVTAGWAVLLVFLGYLWVGADLLGWSGFLVAAAVLSAAVLALQAQFFSRGKRGVFEVVEKRRLLRRNEEQNEEDLRVAVAEVERTTRAYAQFLAWSAIVGRVIARPFGEMSSTVGGRRHPESGLPRNTSVSEIQWSGPELALSADLIRQEVFQVGWGREALREYLRRGMGLPEESAAPEQLHPLFGQPGTHSPLAEIAERCRRGTDFGSFGRAQDLWAKGLARLRRDRADAPEGEDAVVGDLRRAVETIGSHPDLHTEFSAAAVTPVGANNGATEVDVELSYTRVNRREDSLSESYTVVEYGRSVDIRGFGSGPLLPDQHTWEEQAAPVIGFHFPGIGGVDGLI